MSTREYQIVDTDTFQIATTRQKQTVEKIIQDMKVRGLDITPIGGDNNKGLSVDIIKMFKEGSIFKKHVVSGDMPKIATILGVKQYYLDIRMAILNLNLKAVNLYYSHAIGFFDIQNLVRFPKEKQEIILDDILTNTTIKTNRKTRVLLYNKYNTRHYRKLNVDKWKKTTDRSKKNIPSPINYGNASVVDDIIPPPSSTTIAIEEKKFNGWCSFKTCEFPFGAMHSHLHPTVIIEKKPETMQELYEIKKEVTVSNLNHYPTTKEEIKPKFTTAEKLLKEKEYYDNLEMVIPTNAIIEDVD